MDERPKVVALNGSPHGAIGNTSQMIAMLAPALSEQGIDLEEIRLAERQIEYCVGCALCIQDGRCWREDDFAAVVGRLFAADGIILASPVYFGQVTAQMKTFLDRSLAYGHQPRRSWKPGLALSVSAGRGETETARYLCSLLGVYGAFPVGSFTAIATNPGTFLGKEAVWARGRDLAADLARAIREKRRYPVTDENLATFLFIRELVSREREFMAEDYRYWQENRLFDGFESFVGQRFAPAGYDPELRKGWLRRLIRGDRQKREAGLARAGEPTAPADDGGGTAGGRAAATSCREVLAMMPRGFRPEAARGISAVYQFEISGEERFSAHLRIADGRCSFEEGRHDRPDLVIHSPADVWLAIVRGELDGQTAFVAGKYRVEGDLDALLRLETLFR